MNLPRNHLILDKNCTKKYQRFKVIALNNNFIGLIQVNVSKKVGVEEFNEALGQKVDLSTMRSAIE